MDVFLTPTVLVAMIGLLPIWIGYNRYIRQKKHERLVQFIINDGINPAVDSIKAAQVILSDLSIWMRSSGIKKDALDQSNLHKVVGSNLSRLSVVIKNHEDRESFLQNISPFLYHIKYATRILIHLDEEGLSDEAREELVGVVNGYIVDVVYVLNYIESIATYIINSSMVDIKDIWNDKNIQNQCSALVEKSIALRTLQKRIDEARGK